MILSMTGYGKADILYNGKKIHAEIKSLNSKSLDLNMRIAPIYREKEMDIRGALPKNSNVVRWTLPFGWKRTKRWRAVQ